MKEFLAGLGLPDDIAPMIITYGTRIIGIIVLLLLALIISGWVRSLVEKGLKRVKFDETLTRFVGGLARWGVLILAIIGCLGIFGIETTSFAAVIGGASLAIGLAFQGSLSNVAAGVMLLTFRPFTVNQVITAAGKTGKVEEIGLFTTTMNTPDGVHIIIPNGQIFGSTIVNISHNPTRRADVNVGVGYGEDIDETRRVLTQAAQGVATRLAEQDAVVALLNLGDSSVNWQVRVMCKAEDYFATMEATTRAVKLALDEAGLDIPYPHQVVIHQNDAP